MTNSRPPISFSCFPPNFAVCLACFGLLVVAPARAEDKVTYRSKETGQDLTRKGTIVEYTGTELTLEVGTGRETKIATDLVINVESTWAESYKLGMQLFGNGDLTAADEAFSKAIGEEKRQWVLRRIISWRVLCRSGLERNELAVDDFLRLLKADPNTQYFRVIPLNWQTREIKGSLLASAQKWLDSDSSMEQLIGASWMFSTSARSKAESLLKKLANHTDPRIAFLATAQMWRAQAVTATAADFQKWQAIIERMPADLRPGPLFVCGDSMLKRGQDLDESILLMLRVPLLYNQHCQLAAMSLFEAATTLRKNQRVDEAEILLRQLIAEHPQSAYAADARARHSMQLSD